MRLRPHPVSSTGREERAPIKGRPRCQRPPSLQPSITSPSQPSRHASYALSFRLSPPARSASFTSIGFSRRSVSHPHENFAAFDLTISTSHITMRPTSMSTSALTLFFVASLALFPSVVAHGYIQSMTIDGRNVQGRKE